MLLISYLYLVLAHIQRDIIEMANYSAEYMLWGSLFLRRWRVGLVFMSRSGFIGVAGVELIFIGRMSSSPSSERSNLVDTDCRPQFIAAQMNCLLHAYLIC